MKDPERREISGLEVLILGLMFGDDEKDQAPPKKDEPQPKPKRVDRKRES